MSFYEKLNIVSAFFAVLTVLCYLFHYLFSDKIAVVFVIFANWYLGSFLLLKLVWLPMVEGASDNTTVALSGFVVALAALVGVLFAFTTAFKKLLRL